MRGILALAGLTVLFQLSMTQIALAADDYPAPWREPTTQDSLVDDWGYYNRECTSFVAWCLHSRNGFEMARAIGDALTWGDWAAANGYIVDRTPAAGAVAWWNTGVGHVAWVASVNADGTITWEEYNSNVRGGWSQGRDVPSFVTGGFIHFKDIGGTPIEPGGSSSAPATAFVFDVSGSMSEWSISQTKIEEAISAGLDVVGSISNLAATSGTPAQVAVAAFSDTATRVQDLTTDYAAARQKIQGLEPLDMTNLGAGIEVGLDQLSAAPSGATKTMVLLSDGMANEGLSSAEILAGPVQWAKAEV